MPEAAIQAFHITMNSPLLHQPRVSRPKFRLEINSTAVWLYAGGVSLILLEVQFDGFPRLGHIWKSVAIQVVAIISGCNIPTHLTLSVY